MDLLTCIVVEILGRATSLDWGVHVRLNVFHGFREVGF